MQKHAFTACSKTPMCTHKEKIFKVCRNNVPLVGGRAVIASPNNLGRTDGKIRKR